MASNCVSCHAPLGEPVSEQEISTETGRAKMFLATYVCGSCGTRQQLEHEVVDPPNAILSVGGPIYGDVKIAGGDIIEGRETPGSITVGPIANSSNVRIGYDQPEMKAVVCPDCRKTFYVPKQMYWDTVKREEGNYFYSPYKDAEEIFRACPHCDFVFTEGMILQ